VSCLASDVHSKDRHDDSAVFASVYHADVCVQACTAVVLMVMQEVMLLCMYMQIVLLAELPASSE